jgi:hypothetical protein
LVAIDLFPEPQLWARDMKSVCSLASAFVWGSPPMITNSISLMSSLRGVLDKLCICQITLWLAIETKAQRVLNFHKLGGL